MPKRKHEGLELENGSRVKKLKKHEKDKGGLVSKQNPINAAAKQPKPTKQSIRVINDKANNRRSSRVLRKRRRKDQKEHGKEAIDGAQDPGRDALASAKAQAWQQKSKQGKLESKKTDKARWKVLQMAGGRMLDLDPIFALNEEFVNCVHEWLTHTY